MNIDLNLLPNAKKRRLEYILKIFLIKDIVEMFLVVIALLSATLMWSWLFLENEFANLTKGARNVNRNYNSYNQETKIINDLLNNASLATKNFSPITPKLRDLLNSLPPDIKIYSLQIDSALQTATINGVALSRSSLINYQETLNKIPWLTDIQTPVSQLFQKQNIDFEFKAKLKNEKK